jgi:DNA-binding Lrp family transcriptional regulator
MAADKKIYITKSPEQVVTEEVTEETTKEGKEGDFGYRAGDIEGAVPERLGNFRGGRGTGHFGTGYYFFGSEDQAKNYAKPLSDRITGKESEQSRKINKVDFSKYDLLKVKDNIKGLRLHKALKAFQSVNVKMFSRDNITYQKALTELIEGKTNVKEGKSKEIAEGIQNTVKRELEAKSQEIADEINAKFPSEDFQTTKEDVQEDLDDLDFNLRTLEGYVNERISADYGYNSMFREKAKLPYGDLWASQTAVDIIDNAISSYIEKSLPKESRIESMLKRFTPEIKELAEAVADIAPERWTASQAELAIKLTLPKILRRDPYQESHMGKTTVGTELIKALGYNGIDVRGVGESQGMTGLDNSTYGSVIYDLKKTKDAIQERKVTEETTKEEVAEEETAPTKKRLDEQIDGIIKKVKDRTSDKADPKKVNKRAFDDAIEYLQSSLWYEKANDLQREASVIELMEKTKQPIKKSMTMKGAIKKAFPPTPEKRVSMTPLAALKKQIQDFARGMREAAKDQRATAKNANDLLKELQKSGVITPRQAGALTRAALKVNFASLKSIEDFTNRVEKTIRDIEYNTKLSEARKLRGRIKPKKNTLASDKARMNEFRKIDPKNVEDIDAYIEKANEIIAATKSPRRTAKGVSLPTAMDYAAIDEYNKTTLEEQDKKAKQSIKDQYDYLEDFDLTVEEMNEIISLLEQGKEPQLTDARKEQINERLNTLFTFYKPALKEKLTEEALTDTEKKILKSLSDGNINNLPFNEKARTIKIAENILQNNDFSAAQQVVNAIDAQQSVAEMQKMNIKFDTRKTYFQKLASLTQAMKFIFRGVNAANNFAVKAGITDFDIGVVKGTNRIKDLIDRYDAMVKNMDDHNTAENIVKRRVYSFLNRNDGTTATEKKAEFDRRKGLINEQLEYLKLTDGEFAKELETVLSDLGIAEAQTADDIQIDEQNKKIVDFFVQEFEDLYDEHAEVAKVLYNKILPQDSKYVPDVFEKVDKSDMFVGLDESVYFEDAIDTKETSMLQDVSKPSSLPKVNGEVTRAINLDFDRIMMRKLEDAIKEIETAQSVDKLKRVLTTQNLNKFLSPSQADLLKSKITNYVNAIRGKSREQQEIADSKTVNKVIDVISNYTASKILGSAAQPIKQTIPVYIRSTMNMSSKGSAAMNNALIGEAPELVEIANKYGEVSLRGKQSVVDVDALTSKVNFDKLSDSVIKLVGISGAKNIRDAKNSLSKAGEAPLKYALEKPDKWMATASWAGYYTDYLYKNKPDFNLKEELENPTKEAIQYANSRVSETQNESQREKMGDLFTSKSTVAKLIRNVFLPFASFQQNLRTDIYTNIGIAKSKTASKEDIDIARKSIASTLMEMATFNVLSVSLRALTELSINALLDYDDEEEERELEPILGIPLTKKDRNILYTNIISDVAPLPVVDDALLYGVEAVNKHMTGEQYDKYKDNIVYAPGSAEEIILNKGGKFGAAYGIITDTKTKLDMSDLVNEDGTFTKSTIYGDIEYPMPEYLENDINLMIGLQALYLLGAPREFKTASDKIRKEVEKQGKAQRKLEKQLMR